MCIWEWNGAHDMFAPRNGPITEEAYVNTLGGSFMKSWMIMTLKTSCR